MLQWSLLVVSFLLSSVPASAVKEFPKAKKYEVVYPIRLHPLRKRETKEPEQMETFETDLKYKMTVNGKVAVLYLKKNNKLLAPGYSETYYNSSGNKVTTSPQVMDSCYYQGHIINEKMSEASISTCQGLRGFFSQGDERYFIQPLSSVSLDEHAHAIFKDDPNEDQANSSCGVDDILWQRGLHQRVSLPATRLIKMNGRMVQEPKKYIEYYLVLDNGEFKKYNKNLAEIRKRVLEMVNYVNMLYKKLDAHVVLVGMEIWTDEDKIKITPDVNTTLENFSKWRGKDLLKRKHHDVAQLISSTDFSGSTVGLAFMSSMCSPSHSVGIIQDHSNHHLRVAGTMAHEMGHNLGMIHDYLSCKCPSEVCVMEQSLRFHMPTDFSSCSRVNYGKFLEDKLSHCLSNTPLPSDIISPPVCGNQLVEMNEDCDCGTPKECTDKCCDAKTCKIKAGFQCALGECCERCRLKRAGVVCRTARDECDLPEMCDGKSSHCPADRFRVNGFPCQNGLGYCLKGSCPTLQQQCMEMWGPGTKVANKSCYQHNEGGSKYGYCHIENGTYMPCKAKDAMCGKLFCEGGSGNLPWKGLTISFMTCKLFDPEDTSQGIDMVANGTKCGNKKVCINAECVDMEKIYKTANCSSKCKGHAVCDHELQCQCKEGWAPPDCEDSATVFHFSIVVGVLFPLAVIFVVVAIVIRHQSARRMQKRVQRPPSSTDVKLQKQKGKPLKVKAVEPQEMSQMKKLHVSDSPIEENEPLPNVLITKPDFPPPPIPVSLELEGDKTGHRREYSCVLPGISQPPTEASMSWVLLSVFWLIIQTQVIDTKSSPKLKLHEIVHPKKLPISHRSRTENNQTEGHGKEEKYAPEVQYQIILNGEEIIFHLKRTKHLLGPDCTETAYSRRGEEGTRCSQDVEPCCYEGHILNAKDSLARISTCDGLRGYFTHLDQRYQIKPLQGTDEGEHAVLPDSQGEPDTPNSKHGEKHASRKRSHLRISRSLKGPNEAFLQGQKYINLFLVMDNAFYKMYNKNVTRIRSFLFEVMNLLNVIYKTIDVQVSLVDMEIWSDRDKIKVDPRMGATLQNFMRWHYSILGKKKIHNHAQLLSGTGFLYKYGGMAASSSLCSTSSVSVVEAKRKNNVALVALMSHELGHAVGMKDVVYSTKCPSGSCVMNQYLSSKFPKDFSTSSRSLFQRFLSSRKATCLLLAPSPKNIIKPTCGNQLLETGEDCDCGSPEECTNLCCEPLTCRLKSQPECKEKASNHID